MATALERDQFAESKSSHGKVCVLIALVFLCGWLRPLVEIAGAQETATRAMPPLISPVTFSPPPKTDFTAAPPVNTFSLPATPIKQPDVLETAFEIHRPKLLQRLLKRKEPNVSWHLAALSPSANITLISEGAFAAGPPESFSQTRPLTDWHHRIRLLHERPWDNSRYGIDYQYDGNSKDRDRLEVWSAWDFGVTTLKASVARLEDNLGKAPYKPRMMTIKSQVAMDVGAADGPRFGLSYTRALTRSTWEPLGISASKRQLDTVGVALVYSRSAWEAMLTSTYASVQDQVARTLDSINLHHGVSLVYRLVPELIISPSIDYKQEWTRSSQIWTTLRSVSLAVTRTQLLKDIDVTATSSYALHQGPGQVLETHQISTVGSIIWHMEQFWLGTAFFSFDLSYVSFHDAKTPLNSYDGVSGGLVFQLRFS